MSPIAELKRHLSDFSARCLAHRWFGARLHVGVAEDIVADETRVHERIEQEAYSAEQLDLLALKALDDGNESLARRYIARSASGDRKISDMAHV